MAVEFKVEHKRTAEYRILPEDITIKAELNGRHELPDIQWLINDILQRGQTQPVTIRNDGGTPVLVAGFSRWRAVTEINKLNLLGSAAKLQLRCTYVQCNEADAFLINISENRFRNPVTPLDDAHNIKRLLNVYQRTEEEIAGIYFPTAKTSDEIKAATKFVRDRISLIRLTPEAASAVASGRVTPTAAVAISKLSSEQQRKVIAKEGQIERKDVTGDKTAKKTVTAGTPDQELLRRVGLVLEDIEAFLHDAAMEYLEVDRALLLSLHNYVKDLRK